jgi:hypothetical protein
MRANDVLRARGATTFICECAADGCDALVGMQPMVYDGIRAVDGNILADGHPAVLSAAAKADSSLRKHELPALRDSLRRRITDVWERLNDTVSELHELHGVPSEEIVERIEVELEDAGR